ncbi:MAG: hypothetical protein QNJ18_21005 [Xenococcaceae cyanobacterium MO_167.B52]|nr:hypothetical protein [Xenococcaceae cyanobacterium MO_167.B52]
MGIAHPTLLNLWLYWSEANIAESIMNSENRTKVEKFLERWKDSQGNERANYQMFFSEFCDVLGVEQPNVKGSVSGDPYCFDKDVKIVHPSGNYTSGFIDFYKQGHFVIEAKQGSNKTGKGTAKRGTNTYRKAMKKAYYGQSIPYARSLPVKPPFIIVCDIGSHFEIWRGFNEYWIGATGDYGDYEARKTIELTDISKPEVLTFFQLLFTEPQQLNPEKISAQVTREVAEDLAELAKTLENSTPLLVRGVGGDRTPETVANFLMRCIFTMFAEDVGFLKEYLFSEALETRWIPNPKSFKPEVTALWKAMKEGGNFGFHGKLLRFNGNLFADASAFDLTEKQLQILLTAAKRDWKNVEPAIFGTLLERALDSKERSKLGAHYTPRSYVERLVRPVIIEPLQEQWQLVQGEVEQLLDDTKKKPTLAKRNKAEQILKDFLNHLQTIKILDPACGSGNFLYVTLDLMKSLESEVFQYLGEVIGQEQLVLDYAQINPSQFFGIEINPRAAAIADLVIWIGYLQWHYRRFGNVSPIEPVLQAYNNIECRDAVLEYDSKEPAIDKDTGEIRTRWGGKMMLHPVTGESVPDPEDKITIYNYLNPRIPVWQNADYIVSNPPFIGNARMRERLGDGYTEALRKVYSDVPDTVDFVMYWWHKSAQLVREEKVNRFGLITTNSIRQVRQRKVIDFHLNQKKNPIRIFFAIPDHPWEDKGAAVRVSMTACEINYSKSNFLLSRLGTVIYESDNKADLLKLDIQKQDYIFSNLQSGVNILKTISLKSNNEREISNQGIKLAGQGFILNANKLSLLGYELNALPSTIKIYCTGSDLTKSKKNHFVVDFYQFSEQEAREKYPSLYQYIYETVFPQRQISNTTKLKKEWWLYERPRPGFRKGIKKLSKYIATPRTAKHRFFTFLEKNVIPESGIVVISLDDAYFLGILSSNLHIIWSLKAGGWIGEGNDPVYNHARCFYSFPFPTPTKEQKQNIRELGERLDSHRKRVQQKHLDITITGMYNLLEKIRNNQSLTDKEKEYNNRALVSTLKQIHDELDIAVFDAYGWNKNLTDEEILEKLVKLNAERAEEERNGLIRWLRPEYQAPEETIKQTEIQDIKTSQPETITPVEQQKWAKTFKEQLAAIRDLLRSQGGEWTEAQIAAQFKGKKKAGAIANCLEILQGLGLINSHTENEIIRYYAAELQQNS